MIGQHEGLVVQRVSYNRLSKKNIVWLSKVNCQASQDRHYFWLVSVPDSTKLGPCWFLGLSHTGYWGFLMKLCDKAHS